MSKFITNSSELKRDLEIIHDAQDEGMTWGEATARGAAYLRNPGYIYYNGAIKRAGREGFGDAIAVSERALSRYEKNSFRISAVGMLCVGGLTTYVTPAGPVGFALGVLGFVVGANVAPWVVRNCCGAVLGASEDVKTLFRGAANMTLITGARDRVERLKDTPVRRTLRLTSGKSGPGNRR